MLASRTALRATRKSRIQPIFRTARRLESTARPRDSTGPRSPRLSDRTSDAVVGGLVGGGFVALLSYAYYHYSGASTVVKTGYSAKKKFDDALKKSIGKKPEPNEAIQWLRETATSYAAFIPGGRSL